MITWLKHKFRIKSKTFFTSDLHFSHKNVINYCKRPFKDIFEMNEAIIKEWNKTVKEQDTVWILGDFSLNPNVAFRVLSRLNGTKYLVAGNHDGCFVANKKSAKFITKYLENGFCHVCDHLDWITLKDGTKVLLSHLPYIHNKYDDRYKDYKPHDNGEILLHGHLHGRYIKYFNQIDVSWDAHNGKIISEDEVIAIIKDRRIYIPSHLTEFYQNRGDEKYKPKVLNKSAE
jgi:calcineurin-like phosphoesterase family protein